jgi:hypothetical protein
LLGFWTLSIVRILIVTRKKKNKHDVSETIKIRTMDKVQNPSNSVCYTPSSEPYRKYFTAIPLQSQTAEEVTNAFVTNIIIIYGTPTEIVTDQGLNFMSDVFKCICKSFKIEKICTTAYHPVSNGALERTHKILTNYLQCFCDTKLNNWDEWLPFACFTYNTTPHSVTWYIPYEVLFGRIANIPGKQLSASS